MGTITLTPCPASWPITLIPCLASGHITSGSSITGWPITQSSWLAYHPNFLPHRWAHHSRPICHSLTHHVHYQATRAPLWNLPSIMVTSYLDAKTSLPFKGNRALEFACVACSKMNCFAKIWRMMQLWALQPALEFVGQWCNQNGPTYWFVISTAEGETWVDVYWEQSVAPSE